ncbi:MAG: thiamine pyrophosphate-binding protein [Candidatus Gorgyraea atricola]|nr:thiamine pyrophosphate-binding protein [Candidatus Gorgyraea atricola]
MIKLSDYVIDFLVQKGIMDIFMIAGGGIIHLVDSVGRNKNIKYFCNYNEQAVGYCAEGYARLKNHISSCLVTTGPGSTNAISGVASAWVDSVPMMVISGQVKRELIADYSKIRQIGEQEINIIETIKPITKYAKTILDPKMIKYELELAFYKATTGRPGPVWINIPLDVQGSFIDIENLHSFRPKDSLPRLKKRLHVSKVMEMLKRAKRPVILCGYGIRIARAEDLLKQILERIQIPAVLSFNGMDLIPDAHPLLIGKAGIIGQRRANFAIQNSDCLLSIGSRMNIKIVGYNYKAFAPNAKKIIVDVDERELQKSTLSPDVRIQADAKDFLEEFLNQLKEIDLRAPAGWLDACKNWKKRYPSIVNEFFEDEAHVDTYIFYDKLSDLLTEQDVVVTGNGMAALCLYQAFKVKPQQRAFTNNGYGAMGWGLPASIGACIANDRKRTICITGDGSMQMNIQELQLIRHHNLPIKIFIINNAGYTSIRLTQDTFFNSHYVGADERSGISNPDFKKVAIAYGLGYEKILTNKEIESKVSRVLSEPGPILCELNISPHQGLNPKAASYKRADGSFESRPLEDMFPFLSREELAENMSISKI